MPHTHTSPSIMLASPIHPTLALTHTHTLHHVGISTHLTLPCPASHTPPLIMLTTIYLTLHYTIHTHTHTPLIMRQPHSSHLVLLPTHHPPPTHTFIMLATPHTTTQKSHTPLIKLATSHLHYYRRKNIHSNYTYTHQSRNSSPHLALPYTNHTHTTLNQAVTSTPHTHTSVLH